MLENIIKWTKNYKDISMDVIVCLVSAFFLAIAAQISIPLPGGVPMTLQTFSVALIGFTLTRNKGVKAILIYLFLGVIGIPVFASAKFGLMTLFGVTGGFLTKLCKKSPTSKVVR